MKVSSQVFKGIEFVQLNQLPEEQRSRLVETLNKNVVIKILKDGKIISNCLQYKDYEIWYENVFVDGRTAVKQNKPAGIEVVADNIVAHKV